MTFILSRPLYIGLLFFFLFSSCALFSDEIPELIMEFQGSSSESLTSLPASIATGNWISSTAWKADGSIDNRQNVAASAFFPINLVANKLYRISASIEISPIEEIDENDIGWIGFGLSSLALSREEYWKSTLKNPSFVMISQKNTITYYVPSNNTGTLVKPLIRKCKTDSPFEIQIQLDTRPEKWTITYYFNHDEMETSELSEYNQIQYVGFGVYNRISARIKKLEITSQ